MFDTVVLVVWLFTLLFLAGGLAFTIYELPKLAYESRKRGLFGAQFFAAQYESLDESIDGIAGRARSLGANSVGTFTELLRLSHLQEQPEQSPQARQMLEDLLADHEVIIRRLRTDVNASNGKHRDMGTANVLNGLMEEHEKMAGMIRSFLQ